MSSTARSRAPSNSIADSDVLANLASFTRHLRAENKAPSTIITYAKAVEQLGAFLAEPRRRRPRRVADIRREDVEAFLVERSDAHARAERRLRRALAQPRCDVAPAWPAGCTSRSSPTSG
jgi:site-specific recombinase XerD